MATSRELCCLCLSSVPSDHRRRKNFHGESCLKARSVIRSLTDEQYVELNDPFAVLCNACERKAINISVFEDKAEKLKLEVKSNLSRLLVYVPSAKRPSLPLNAPSEPASKRSRPVVTSHAPLSGASSSTSVAQSAGSTSTIHSTSSTSRAQSTLSSIQSTAQSLSTSSTSTDPSARPTDSSSSPDIQVRFS